MRKDTQGFRKLFYAATAGVIILQSAGSAALVADDYLIRHEERRPQISPACLPAWGYHKTCWQRFPPLPPCETECGICNTGITPLSGYEPTHFPGPHATYRGITPGGPVSVFPPGMGTPGMGTVVQPPAGPPHPVPQMPADNFGPANPGSPVLQPQPQLLLPEPVIPMPPLNATPQTLPATPAAPPLPALPIAPSQTRTQYFPGRYSATGYRNHAVPILRPATVQSPQSHLQPQPPEGPTSQLTIRPRGRY